MMDVIARASVIDLIRCFVGVQQPDWTWRQLKDSHPEVHGLTTDFKFKGRGQRVTAVSDAKGLVQILMLLPGTQAARVTWRLAFFSLQGHVWPV